MQQTGKQKRFWYLIIALSFVVTVLLLFYWYSFFRYQDEVTFKRYEAFGTDIPVNYSIHGIDVSKHQDKIHWPAVRKMNVKGVKIEFAFIKATEGLESVDKHFAFNWKHAGLNDIPKGAYHYFLATKNGQSQAINFIKTVPLQKGDLPPVVDVEELYGTHPKQMKQQLKQCLQSLELYYKVKPIIYTYVSFYNTYLGKEFDQYPLWIAHYEEKEKPGIARPWIFWQHSEKGRVNGINDKVDLNVFYGNDSSFEELLIK